MFVSSTFAAGQDLFEIKRLSGRDLYDLLIAEINKLGPVQETRKAISISLENRKPFASVLIRDRSLKLVVRTARKIVHERILNAARVDGKRFDHTVLLDSRFDIDAELIQWLEEAYHSGE